MAGGAAFVFLHGISKTPELCAGRRVVEKQYQPLVEPTLEGELVPSCVNAGDCISISALESSRGLGHVTLIFEKDYNPH
ncbi:hypothetical protein lerEdw1_010233 [Lerista edwardsae]|nr:hypothetical protein lerEdw1_010233 [Lerista edwardsae]